jgi:radical SAM superfamily enzyme
MKKNHRIKKLLLGLGFDCNDGRKRITVGDNFRLYGGSKMTHETMKEKAIKFNEQLKKRDKTLDDVSEKEVYEIAYKIGLRPLDEEKEGRV